MSKGYATETTDALRQVAFKLKGVKEVEVQCDPKNFASKRIPQKLGFKLVETHQKDKLDPFGQPRNTEIWRSHIIDSLDPTSLTIYDSSGDQIYSESE